MPIPTFILRATAAVVLLVVLLGGVAPVSDAQDFSAERRGLAASVGMGVSNAGLACKPRCQADRRTGPVFMARGTANVAAQFAVAGEVNAFRQSVPTLGGSGRWAFTWVTLTALWYPRSEQDVYFKLGAGVASVRADVSFAADATSPPRDVGNMKSNHLGLVVGIGRDFRLTDHIAITAYADFLTMTRATAYIASTDSGARFTADLVNLGLALTIF